MIQSSQNHLHIIFLQALIFSTNIKNTLPPSNAGKGNIFIIPTFNDKYAVIYNKKLNAAPNLYVNVLPMTWYIPTGPDRLDKAIFPVNKPPSVYHNEATKVPNLVNAYFICPPNDFETDCFIPIPNTCVSFFVSSSITLFGLIWYSSTYPSLCFIEKS